MNDFGNGDPLRHLDPGSRDPSFWPRFHSRVMGNAREELARRRMTADVTILDVVFAWRRALVPVALLAAAWAGILLFSHDPESPAAPVALEQALIQDLTDATIPVVLEQGGEGALQGVLLTAAGGF